MNKLQSFSQYLNDIAARNEPLRWRGQTVSSLSDNWYSAGDTTTANDDHWIDRAANKATRETQQRSD